MSFRAKTKTSFHRLSTGIRRQFIGDNGKVERRGDSVRIVLYSHDTMGIGHMRRNLLIAGQIVRCFPGAQVLVIAGAREASTFSQKAGIDCLTLPSFFKNSDGRYTSRNLEISANELLDLRSHIMLAALTSFQPDLLIVDKVPAGAGGELLPSLERLNAHSDCRCVLGLRDILDEPDQVARDWELCGTLEVIRRHFASIWIYGDPDLYDLTRECSFPIDLLERVSFTGYLNTESRLQDLQQLPYEVQIPFDLCTVGGGQDGMHLAMNFVEAVRITGRNSVLLTGPCMPESERLEIHRRAGQVASLKVVEFADEGDLLIRHASRVVSMGGYNTVTAIVSHRRPALVVPRVTPRLEQWIRAVRLAERGLISTVHPDKLSPQTIAEWLNRHPDDLPPAGLNINMNGLNQIAALVQSYFPAAKQDRIDDK